MCARGCNDEDVVDESYKGCREKKMPALQLGRLPRTGCGNGSGYD